MLSSPSLRPMKTSILLRPSSSPSPSPSPSPVSTPLPALHPDLSSSSSSASGSCLDFHPTASTRRIRFAPLPEPQRDVLFVPDDLSLEPAAKPATELLPAPDSSDDGFVALSPSISPSSTHSSARSTPTIRPSPNAPVKIATTSGSRLFRPFAFFRRANSSPPSGSPLFQSASLPGSCTPSVSSLHPASTSTSAPSSPAFRSAKLTRLSREDLLPFSTKSLFRTRSGSTNGSRPSRPSSPPPKHPLHRCASTGSGPGMKLGTGKRDRGQGSAQSHDSPSVSSSGSRKRRASSSVLAPGAGSGRHASSVKMAPNPLPTRPSTAPSSYHPPLKKQVKMLNGRVYGAKRYAAQTLANPFANVRDDPEFVEWGYGGMGSVQASAGIANDVWKGLQRSERGGALLAGSGTARVPTAAGGRGGGAHTTPSVARRRMSTDAPECGMGNVGAGGLDEDDGSGMGWVKRRRAEREAKARSEQESKEKTQEWRKSHDSLDASMYASTASTTTSLTACTSTTSTDLTSPSTTPLTSRSPSLTDLTLTSPPSSECRDCRPTPPCAVHGQQTPASDISTHPVPMSKDEHERHVFTAVRLSPKHNHTATHGRAPSLPPSLSPIDKEVDGRNTDQITQSPVDTETTGSTNSSDEHEEEPDQGSDEEEEQDHTNDDNEDEAQDIRRKTVVGAGVEKISRHAR